MMIPESSFLVLNIPHSICNKYELRAQYLSLWNNASLCIVENFIENHCTAWVPESTQKTNEYKLLSSFSGPFFPLQARRSIFFSSNTVQ